MPKKAVLGPLSSTEKTKVPLDIPLGDAYPHRPMIHIGKIARTGNSEYVVLPKPLLRALGLGRKDQVAITVIGNAIAITKVDASRLFDQSRIRAFGSTPKPAEAGG